MSIEFLKGVYGSNPRKRNLDSEFDKKCHELRLKGCTANQVQRIMIEEVNKNAKYY